MTGRIHRIAGRRPNGKAREVPFSWAREIRRWQRREQPFVDKVMLRSQRWGKSWESAMRLAVAVERGDVAWRDPARITVATRNDALDSLVASQLAYYGAAVKPRKGFIAIHYDASVSPDGEVTTAPGFPYHREPRPFRPVRDFGLPVDPEYARLVRATHGPWVDPQAIQDEINATVERIEHVQERGTWPYTFMVGVDNPSAPVVSDPEETIDP